LTHFLLVRHGQTDWNLEGRYSGQSDVPLNQTGIGQAYLAADSLAGYPLDAVFSSDLQRARQTAEIIAAHFNLVVVADPRLREIDQGAWEGMQVDEIRNLFALEFEHMRSDPINVGPPDGETVGQVQARVLASAEEIAQKYPNGRVALVSHGLSLAIIKAYMQKVPIEEVWGLIPPNATVETLHWGPEPSR
jgi:broad specificity phosphatase PhoE